MFTFFKKFALDHAEDVTRSAGLLITAITVLMALLLQVLGFDAASLIVCLFGIFIGGIFALIETYIRRTYVLYVKDLPGSRGCEKMLGIIDRRVSRVGDRFLVNRRVKSQTKYVPVRVPDVEDDGTFDVCSTLQSNRDGVIVEVEVILTIQVDDVLPTATSLGYGFDAEQLYQVMIVDHGVYDIENWFAKMFQDIAMSNADVKLAFEHFSESAPMALVRELRKALVQLPFRQLRNVRNVHFSLNSPPVYHTEGALKQAT